MERRSVIFVSDRVTPFRAVRHDIPYLGTFSAEDATRSNRFYSCRQNDLAGCAARGAT